MNRSKPLYTYAWGSDTMITCRFNPTDSNLIAATGTDRTIVLYDVRADKPATKLVMQVFTSSLLFPFSEEDMSEHSFTS
jgi:WD repeat and SOF domain-containing protein 1